LHFYQVDYLFLLDFIDDPPPAVSFSADKGTPVVLEKVSLAGHIFRNMARGLLNPGPEN
jgi:hypothetical protein